MAERVGLSLRTVRFYEEAGLVLPAGRTPGGFRLYRDAAIERLLVIKQMKPLGFTLEEMRNLLEARADLETGALTAEELRERSGRLALFAAMAREKCEDLRRQLEVAESFAATLSSDVIRLGGEPAPTDPP